MKKIINFIYKKFKNFFIKNNNQIEIQNILKGKILIDSYNKKIPNKIEDIEFKVFSQFGDDGIIQFLINKLEIDYKFFNFIEFGVENYQESNTRFLLINNNWSGLILDSSKDNVDQIKNNNFFWKHDLEAISCFVDVENINKIINDSKINKKNIGILSIDIDGNDYWIWNEINAIDPLIVIIEFNSVFGFSEKISIPYQQNFNRTKAHYSNLYWGASLEALKYLGNLKGYKFFSTNSAGNNAYFIKKELYNKIDFSLKKNSYQSKFRESRNLGGKKSYIHFNERINLIKDLKVENVETNHIYKIGELNINN